MDEQIPEKHLFMMCRELNVKVTSELPEGFHIRNCRKEELGIWKAIHFDSPQEAEEYKGFMTDFFNEVYLPKGEEFFRKCLFVCNEDDQPVGTCFIWKAYDKIQTVHWYKVLKAYEGRGIGRALLSTVMKSVPENAYPVFLHTHPSSYRAIKLYSDFGFSLLSDPVIGSRPNDLEECLPILEKYMPKADFEKLQVQKAPEFFMEAIANE